MAGLFAEWDALPATPYGGVSDSREIRIRHGDKTVSGGTAAPRQLRDLYAHITELAAQMPVVER